MDKFGTKELAQARADELTESTGNLHLAVPFSTFGYEFYVIAAPKIGDKVSMYFNGDSYPCGTIVRISKTLRKVTTSEGTEFYRFKDTGKWVNAGTWSMIPGHVEKQNPSV